METKITSLEISPQQESFLVRIGNTKIGSLWANTLHFLFGQKNHASDFSCFLFGEDNISFPFAVLITPIIAAITNIININQEPVLSDYWLTIMTFCVSLGFYTARKSNVYDSIDKFFTFSMVSAIFLLFPLNVGNSIRDLSRYPGHQQGTTGPCE
jgi:hypothetical protein